MKIIGLTGGIGSGKSTAADRFRFHAIPVVDADAIGHEILEPGGLAESPVIQAFGQNVVVNGRIDRTQLGEAVFGDPERRQRLNRIVHPVIFQVIAARCTAHAEAGHGRTIVDAALLGEQGNREPFLDGLVLVLAPDALRIRWLIDSRGMTEQQVRERMAAQTPPESKVAIADWVIQNDGTLDRLHAQVDAIVREWQAHA